MGKQKSFLGQIINEDQYEALEIIADKYGRTPKQMFGPKENVGVSSENGLVTELIIVNSITFLDPKSKDYRSFSLPKNLKLYWVVAKLSHSLQITTI